MKKFVLLCLGALTTVIATAQITFDPHIDVNYITDEILVPASPLQFQVIFIGGYDTVQTTPTYGNPATQTLAKQWHDFIGFTPDTTGQSLGWISVNHEMVLADDFIGDGGGMTVFRVTRDPNNDTLIILPQTLSDGRSGKFFNVDFVNTTGETGMNCGGISSQVDGRIWTAEEWFRGSNKDIADRDTSDFIIGQGTVNGIVSPAGFLGFNGQQVKKYQNYNYMVEIDPREAVAIRKQYNWGRQEFEGGTILSDNRTVFTGSDATPGWLTKFVADVPGDFTSGKTYVYKHDEATKWVEIDNTDLNKMLTYADQAVAAGATMFNRLEWLAYDTTTGLVYIAETGRDNPASRWRGESGLGAVHAPHHLARATAQGTHPDSSAYWDYYGRVLVLDPTSDDLQVFLEGGPDLSGSSTSPSLSNYPEKHLTNPDGLTVMYINGQSYLIINEDLNGRSYGRVPRAVDNSTCELWMLDLSITNPEVDDLLRIAVVPLGAEVTGSIATPDGKTLLVNSQHPSTSNPFPFNNSLTFALTGWDAIPSSVFEAPTFTGEAFEIFPNPASRMLYFNIMSDVALYNINGQRIRVYRNVNNIDIHDLTPGTYFIQNQDGITRKLVVQH